MKGYWYFLLLLGLCVSCTGNQGGHSEDDETWVEYEDRFVNPKRDKLVEWILSHPESLDEDLTERAEEADLRIIESDDGQIRIYSWISGGGTCPDWTNVFQYRDSEGKVHADYSLPVMGKGIDAITGTDIIDGGIIDGKKTYFFDFYAKASSSDGYNDVYAVTVHKDTFALGPQFERNGKLEESVGINYDIPDWYFRSNTEGWDWLFYYQPEKHRFYASTTDDRMITHRYDVYEYNGKTFGYIGNHASPLLHESLSDYSCLANLFETEGHLVRVDRMRNGSNRLALWNNPSFAKQSHKPDLVVGGGIYNEENSQYEFSLGSGMKYVLDINNEDLQIVYKGNVIHQERKRMYDTYIDSWIMNDMLSADCLFGEEKSTLQRLYRTDHYVVRVDSLLDGTYRYSSWKVSLYPEEFQKPDLILVNGRLKTIDFIDYYVFKNGGYTYKVPVDEYYQMEVANGNERICKERIVRRLEPVLKDME